MADPLYELLLPYVESTDTTARHGTPLPPPASPDSTTSKYLNRLSTLSLSSLTTTEPQSLSQSSHSVAISLQALSNRSHKAFISSADHLGTLRGSIARVIAESRRLRNGLPKLDEEAVRFSSTYSKSAENEILDRRKQVMKLSRNVDRVLDILELPTILSTAVSTPPSAAAGGGIGSGASGANYSSALDLFTHMKRLQTIYPNSAVVKDIAHQAEGSMKELTSNLIAMLRSQNIRLAAAMRTVGWLRRVAPELEFATAPSPASTRTTSTVSAGPNEGVISALFLVCRLANLISTLEALDPLRELADQETQKRLQQAIGKDSSDWRSKGSNIWLGGQQTERYLKRYIEIYREQSFAIISLYRSIFAPAGQQSASELSSVGGAGGLPDRNGDRGRPGICMAASALDPKQRVGKQTDPLSQLPSALATFPMHLALLLTETLGTYLPNVKDKSSRESLLTQVLYCAGSLGRLGADFSLMLSLLQYDEGRETDDAQGDGVSEWEDVMRKHRILSERLDMLTSSGATDSMSRGSASPRADPESPLISTNS